MKFKSITLMSLLGLFIFSGSAHAIPNLISYQGVLNDDQGAPISSTVSMTFNMYDVLTGGSPLWNETQSVQVSNGLFNVQLGTVNPIPSTVFYEDTLYLGIQVASDPEMTPRQRITSGTYSYKAKMIEHSGLPIGTILAWAGNLSGVPALQESWVECNGQTISDSESPLDGQVIPNLNGANRFLRGNSTSGTTGGAESKDFTTGGPSSTVEVTGTNTNVDRPGSQNHTHSGSINVLPPYYNVVWIMKIK